MKLLCSPFFLRVVLLVGFVLSSSMATAESTVPVGLTKDAVLQNLARNVIAPAYAELDSACGALADAVEALHAGEDAEALNRARSRWFEAAWCARKIECFKTGPVVEGGYAPAFYFCPIRTASIERVVTGSEPLSEARVEELGAAAKGLCAIEYLLFRSASDASGARRRLYLHLLARELAGQAGRLAAEWREPRSASAVRFVQGGQDSLNRLVNQLAWSLESLNETQLRPLAVGEVGAETMGTASGLTKRLLLASMEGIRGVYGGGEGVGLDDWLRHLRSPVEERMDEQLRETLAAVAELDRPPAAGVDGAERARAAYAVCHATELLIKVDVASALGVTLTFSPVDGD